jgi:hypothetical protein
VLFRLLRTIVFVITNPNRSLAWKVIDSVFLLALFILVLAVLLNPSVDDLLYFFLLVPLVVLVTYRSWYSMPRSRGRRVRPAADQSPPSPTGPGPVGDAPTHAWDPIDDDRLASLRRRGLADDRPGHIR